MSRQITEAEGNEKLVANKFGVATQDIYVATRTRLVNKNYVATLSKSVATESKNKPREQVATENNKQRKKLKTLLRQNFLCCDRVTDLG